MKSDRPGDADEDAALCCEIEMPSASDPHPDHFRLLLEIALRIAELNAKANAA